MTGSVLGFINFFITVLQILFLARFVLQIIDQSGRFSLTRLLIDITEPILAPFRRLLPTMGGLDFSPTIVLVLLVVLQRFLATRL